MTHIFAISNHKGGVAKTTSCLSLGASLAGHGHRILMVDLDSQAHLTLAVGLDPDSLPTSIADVLDPDISPHGQPSVVQATAVPGLDILPGDLRLAEIDYKLFGCQGFESRLARALAPWQPNYDFILLDCPPSLGGITLMALTAADYTLIPVTCDYFATRGVIHLLDLVEAVCQRTNPGLQYLLFVTMYDGRTLISQRILGELRAHFPDHLLDTVISIDTRLRESALAGEPVLRYAPRTRSNLQYGALADELLARID